MSHLYCHTVSNQSLLHGIQRWDRREISCIVAYCINFSCTAYRVEIELDGKHVTLGVLLQPLSHTKQKKDWTKDIAVLSDCFSLSCVAYRDETEKNVTFNYVILLQYIYYISCIAFIHETGGKYVSIFHLCRTAYREETEQKQVTFLVLSYCFRQGCH